jgi:Tfp pilus assembly protein PilV
MMAVSSMLRVLISFLVLIIASVCVAQVPVNSKMRSFSSAVKSGHLVANQELVLYESNTGEPGVITEQWFTGKCINASTHNIKLRTLIFLMIVCIVTVQMFLCILIVFQ